MKSSVENTSNPGRRLSLDEAEALAQLYMDAMLSRADEKRLMKVLSQSNLSSPLLDETRALMGLELSLGGKSGNTKRRLTFRRIAIWSASAAAILILAVSFLPGLNENAVSDSPECVAYVNGRRMSDKEASRIASEAYRESMRELARLQAVRAEQLSESQMMMNQVN